MGVRVITTELVHTGLVRRRALTACTSFSVRLTRNTGTIRYDIAPERGGEKEIVAG